MIELKYQFAYVSGQPIDGLTGPQGPAGPDGPNNITINTNTNISGLLKGNGSKVSAATAGTDYIDSSDSRLASSSEKALWNSYQAQIDAITSQSDVIDVVADKAALNAYSKPVYKDDIVKVLEDESQLGAITYYKVGGNVEPPDQPTPPYTWIFIGSQGPYYTKSESNDRFGVVDFADERIIIPGNKGSIITMDLGNGEKQYRVLNRQGNVAEVLAMYAASSDQVFNDTVDNTYSGSKLDIYLNQTFYDTLSSTAKAAIVDKNIVQYKYGYTSADVDTHSSRADYSTKEAVATVGDRHIYALDVEDIEIYFGNVFSTTDLSKMFWNIAVSPIWRALWLRSARSSKYVWRVETDPEYYCTTDSTYGVTTLTEARPAFQIDLSKISWS